MRLLLLLDSGVLHFSVRVTNQKLLFFSSFSGRQGVHPVSLFGRPGPTLQAKVRQLPGRPASCCSCDCCCCWPFVTSLTSPPAPPPPPPSLFLLLLLLKTCTRRRRSICARCWHSRPVGQSQEWKKRRSNQLVKWSDSTGWEVAEKKAERVSAREEEHFLSSQPSLQSLILNYFSRSPRSQLRKPNPA